jgi:hypothetical protein
MMWIDGKEEIEIKEKENNARNKWTYRRATFHVMNSGAKKWKQYSHRKYRVLIRNKKERNVDLLSGGHRHSTDAWSGPNDSDRTSRRNICNDPEYEYQNLVHQRQIYKAFVINSYKHKQRKMYNINEAERNTIQLGNSDDTDVESDSESDSNSNSEYEGGVDVLFNK